MRSTLIADNGDRLNVLPLPQQQAVMLWSHDKPTGKVHQMIVPVDMVGAFTQAIDAAALVAVRDKNGPGTLLQCSAGQHCELGLVACPRAATCARTAVM